MNSEEEEEDDLGYYPDGVKRTLTDDQVAMFRNSEIYSLRRKRQIQEENREADGGSGTAAEAVERSPQSLDYPSKEDLEKRRGSENSDGTEGTEDIVQKRQKRDENGKKSSCSEAPPSRRQIRELDGMITGVDYLDYGEEPSVSQGTKHGAVLDLPSQPHGEYAGYGIQNDAREIKTTESPKQGRKIWWPSIG